MAHSHAEPACVPRQFATGLLRPVDGLRRQNRHRQTRSGGNVTVFGGPSGNQACHEDRQAASANPGFADSTYHGLHAFYFVNESNLRTPVRWALLPMQPALPPAPGHNALFDALVRQLRSAPLRWRLMLTVGAVSDPVRDPTLPWPADRRAVDAGC
ncbi:catalase family protein [Mycobacterium xenopi 4042]|uniref:Catalase family protein n=1 Tax=Mycobacterium xenopi 4042 TaxID=1299334 RepID=X8DCZ3_MYCXE|nr:catalase family protein [Mycobacterium xenopi 4042]